MFSTSSHTLKLQAALVWYSGSVVLFVKSASLLIEAEMLSPDQVWVWLAILGGLVLGGVKAKHIFSRTCIKNLRRIDALEEPKFWQFYRIRFFIFLLTMVILGTFLSRLAQGNYPMLITVALVDFSVATALLGSGRCFWREQ